nr:vimentin homolog - mouse (fragments) [Mus musculus]
LQELNDAFMRYIDKVRFNFALEAANYQDT